MIPAPIGSEKIEDSKPRASGDDPSVSTPKISYGE